MKRNSLTFQFRVLLPLLLLAPLAQAQEPEPDSIVVVGTVVNRLGGEPEPYCSVVFLRGTDTVASAICDAEGAFGIDPIPTGTYGLAVSLRGMTLYQADLVLGSNADLYISVITDSFQLRTLREVEIVAPGHLLAEQDMLIDRPDDLRLWVFDYRWWWALWGLAPEDRSASSSADPNAPRAKGELFYNAAKESKNPRIWQLWWPDRPAAPATDQSDFPAADPPADRP